MEELILSFARALGMQAIVLVYLFLYFAGIGLFLKGLDFLFKRL